MCCVSFIHVFQGKKAGQPFFVLPSGHERSMCLKVHSSERPQDGLELKELTASRLKHNFDKQRPFYCVCVCLKVRAPGTATAT